MQSELNVKHPMTAVIGHVTAADRLANKTATDNGLSRRPRIGEDLIRGILLLCGIVSIFTTIGIIFVLGSEALRLFTTHGWLNSNHRLAEAADAEATTLQLTSGGSAFAEGQIIQIGAETLRIVAVYEGDTLLVERGYEGTQPTAHDPDSTLFVGASVSPVEFLTGTRWLPQLGEFGIWPLLNSTLMTSGIAMLVALPLGLGAAVYLSEYASPRKRAVLKPILEILAGIPTVVFGYFALTFMTPLLRAVFGQDTVQVYNVASAGIVMGIMIVPTISSMSEDALSAVPRSLREASYGLGATRLETIFRVLLPAALSGIVAAFILGISRAIGETMIVAIAAGAGPNLTFNPFEAAETITGHIARISTGDLSFGSIDYNSLFALGLALFVMTLALNIVSGAITRRFREVYA